MPLGTIANVTTERKQKTAKDLEKMRFSQEEGKIALKYAAWRPMPV
jgi:hypothetical protein